MNISELISTPERERILRQLLYSTETASLYQIAKKANVSPSQVHKYLAIWKKHRLLEGRKTKDKPLVRALRLSENILFLRNSKLVKQIRELLLGVEGIGLFGSWAKGTNDENADIDIWILVEKEIDDLTIGKMRRTIENKLKRKIDLTVLTTEKLKTTKEKNPTFYFSLYHSIKLWGKRII